MLQDDKKKKVGQVSDVLDAIGHDNEKKGIEYTQYFMDLWDKKEKERQNKRKDKLEDSLGFKKMEYYRILSGMIGDELKDLDIPHGYVARTEFTESGVVLRLTTYNGKKFNRAFKPVGDPEIDFNAVVGLLVDLQDTVDQSERVRMQNLKDMGIIIPS